MGDGRRNHVEYTTAERMAFQIVPETCPEIEAAFDKAKHYDHSDWNNVLGKYDIALDQQLTYAIHEIVGKAVFNALYGLDKVVKFQGTFPLRQGLVEVMEDHLREKGIEPEPSHFAYWIKMYGNKPIAAVSPQPINHTGDKK